MIVNIPISKNFNEKTLMKDQDFELLQAFINAVANKGMTINKHTKIVCDFRSKPGIIMVSSYPPVIWNHNMKTMYIAKLHDKSWMAYREQVKRFRKGERIKVRSQDAVTGEIKTKTLAESGFVVP